jgi:NADPH-dependent 2,4-dienoyl-CoA reductase/sulfur reductase-like enzyme
MTGIETAEYLAANGATVTLFEMAEAIGPGLFFQNLIDLMSRLGEHQPGIFCKHKLLGIDGNRASFQLVGQPDAEPVSFQFDAFLLALGVQPNTTMIAELQESFERVHLIGDCLQGGRLEPAISGAYQAVLAL